MGIKHNNRDNLDVFNITEIIKPYRSAGTKSNPVKMDGNTLAGALVVTGKIPADIAGAVIFNTCYDIVHNGLDFPGNGQYGTKWAEMFNYMRNQCIELQKKSAAREITVQLLERMSCVSKGCPSRTKKIKKQTKKEKIKQFLFIPRMSLMSCCLLFTAISSIAINKMAIFDMLIRWMQ